MPETYECLYSPRFIWRPVLVAIIDRDDEIERYWDPQSLISVWHHGIYILKESTMPKKDPENLHDFKGGIPSHDVLEQEALLLLEQQSQHDSTWIARRVSAILKHLGYKPINRFAVPKDHPRKIPNRRLP